MAQWINVLWNNGFVNPTQLPLLCEKTGALAIVEPGLSGVVSRSQTLFFFCHWVGKKGSGERSIAFLF